MGTAKVFSNAYFSTNNYMMEKEESLQEIAAQLGITVREDNFSLSYQLLVDRINVLLDADFQALVSILYRMDVSETKLKQLLQESAGIDAGNIIADLMIERQAEKIRSRQQFGRKDDEQIDENEKW